MSVPELPYNIPSPEEALYSLSNITKLIDELRLHLNKSHERNQTMYNFMVAKIKNINLQMKFRVVTIFDLSLSESNYQNIFV